MATDPAVSAVRESGGLAPRLQSPDLCRVKPPNPVSMPAEKRPGAPLASGWAAVAAAGKLIWLDSVVLRGSRAWVGEEEELSPPSTLTGPDMSLLSSPSLEGGRVLLRRRSTVMKLASGLVFLIRV